LGTSTDDRSDRWVKFYVRALDNPIFTSLSPATTKLFVILLCRANWKDSVWFDGVKPVLVPRGSLVTSAAKIEQEFGLTRQQTRDALGNLQKLGVATTRTTNRYSIITVCNYDRYQGGLDEQEPAKEPKENQQGNQSRTSGGTTLLEYIESVDNTLPAQAGDFSLISPSGNGNKRKTELATVIEELAPKIHARHPTANGRRDIGTEHVVKSLNSIAKLASAQDRVRLIRQVDENHAAWCETDHWKNGYAKSLENWLAPTKGRYKIAPSVEREPSPYGDKPYVPGAY
jgi:hypothetical protein